MPGDMWRREGISPASDALSKPAIKRRKVAARATRSGSLTATCRRCRLSNIGRRGARATASERRPHGLTDASQGILKGKNER